MTRINRHLLATAVVLTVTVSACGGAADLAEEPVDPGAVEAPTDATEDDDATGDDNAATGEEPAEPADTDTAAPAEDPAPARDATDLEGIEVQPDGRELMLRIDDEELAVGWLDPEGESLYRHAKIWPGSTRDRITIVAVTHAEGMFDLRWLTVTDGREDVPVQALPTQYQPNTEMVGAADVAPIPVFSPDGAHLAWLDWNVDGEVSLRTVGWDEGPGTGRTADDNASFALEEVPAGVYLRSWEAAADDTSALHGVDEDGTTWTITVLHQADGALALGSDAVQGG